MFLLAIRFLVELAGVVALAFVGATAPAETLWRVVLGSGAPLALVVVWAIVVAPKARNPLSLRTRSLIGTLLLVAIAGLLAADCQPAWGIALASMVLLDEALLVALGLDRAPGTMPTMSHTESHT